MMIVYSEVARASGRGRRVGRVGLVGVVVGAVGEVVDGPCVAAMTEGVVVFLCFRLVTVAHVIGLALPRGGKAMLWASGKEAGDMESWEGGRGRVSIGGWDVKRTCLVGGVGGALYFLKEGQSDSGRSREGVCSAHLQKCRYLGKKRWNSASCSV
jgi:hypothetical protein